MATTYESRFSATSVTRFSGGERGMMFQLNAINGTSISIPKDEAVEMLLLLMKAIMGYTTEI